MIFLPPEIVAAVHTLADASEVRVYEGLPHPRDEPELLASEAERVQAIEFIADRFYPGPEPLRPDDLEFVRSLARQPEWFSAIGVRYCDGREQFGDVKLCLFHADFALEWEAGGKTRRILLCFGCGESVYFDPDVEVTSYTAQEPELRRRLLQYQRQRPSSEAWPGPR
ncbi:MAG: hypothetical protein JSR82_04350 [Verrucomicrobia bacterium]|nr:hypothetical protein [Verrucomicrobiota bacterium]